MNIFDHLSTKWQSREEIERRYGAPCMSQLVKLHHAGQILHMTEVSCGTWVHKYCLRSRTSVDPLIGKTHLGRIATS